MKRLLTIAAVLIGMAGAGQKPDTLRIDPAETITIGGDLLGHRTITPKYDTVAIVYLYCDTARITRVTEEYQMRGGKLFIERDTLYYEPNYELRWDFGYEVREYAPHHIRVFYLDRHKQPIRKTMIIWQTKTINNGTN